MPKLVFTLALGFCLLVSCAERPADSAHDHFSFANSRQFITRHLALDLTVDFEARALHGTASLEMERLDAAATRILLDTRELHIDGVQVEYASRPAQAAAFRLLAVDPMLGQPLEITLPDGFEPPGPFRVRIAYRTSPGATALQWLPPELTAGGRRPFLFSQSQSIHARSWVPLQDTPAVRFTYSANIRTPPDLLALMSADNDPAAERDGEYHFEMPQPIPSYLLAIAVGDVHFAAIGPDTGVYAEPEVLQAAAWEFADTQAMLEKAAAIYGPYRWGRYDLLILPPSFPYGGMENPRLSFITPAVLAGDRSLVSLIAHELAHSWSGNLVTNATWRDFWLNEGITSYLDARLMELLYGTQSADEERYLRYQDLLAQFEFISPAMQALAPDMRGADPDESQGSVHYTKGQMLLEHLERRFGREPFDRFLAEYFEHFAWQSITTEQFLDYLDAHLLSKYPGRYSREQAGQWLYQPGLPDDAPVPRAERLERASAVALAWAAGELGTDALPVSGWGPHVITQLINALPPDVAHDRLGELDAHLGLSATRNAEIGRAWFAQVAKRGYRAAYPQMTAYLHRIGRIWMIEPVYRALAENGEDLATAREIFASARGGYHPLTITRIEHRLAATP